MAEVRPEIRKCARCFLTGTLNNFGKSKKGEWFKQCNNCRTGCRERAKLYNEVHKDTIKQKRKEYQRNAKEKKQKQHGNAMDICDAMSKTLVTSDREDSLPSSNIFSSIKPPQNDNEDSDIDL